MTHEIDLVTDRALVYRQVNTDKQRRYRITKTFVTDPARACVLIDVDFESLDGGKYAVYAIYDPSLNNSGRHDAGSISGGALVAREGDIASALVADEKFVSVSNGYLGTSDGWTDLADFKQDWAYSDAADGNVVQTARLPLDGKKDQRLTLSLGFGTTGPAAVKTARDSLRLPFFLTGAAYALGWAVYLESLDREPKSVGRGDLLTQYRVAAMTLRAHEDKTYRGANIASLTIPWGQAIDANEAGVGGYHLVWARDLYQVSTAQIAIGDSAAAERSLDYLFDVQQKPDGSFPQNSLLDGTPYWGSLQLDEVAFPIVLAWQLKRTDRATYRDHVKPAADFIVARGPATPQERWEEEGGYSPSTIAAEIAGLTAASSLAKANGDANSAALYQGVADEWQRRVEGWTFTTTGPHGDGRYFERIDDNGNPNDGHIIDINNGGGQWDERSIVDAGFLDLVRLGVKRFNDPFVTASLPEVDSVIRVAVALLPLQPRRLRREGRRHALRRDRRRAAVAAADRRAWRVRAGERPRRRVAPAGDGRHGERRLDDPRAGVGQAGRVRVRVRRGHGQRDAAGVVDGRLPAAGRVDRRGQAGRDAVGGRGPLHAGNAAGVAVADGHRARGRHHHGGGERDRDRYFQRAQRLRQHPRHDHPRGRRVVQRDRAARPRRQPDHGRRRGRERRHRDRPAHAHVDQLRGPRSAP